MNFNTWNRSDLDTYFRSTYVGLFSEDIGMIEPLYVAQVVDTDQERHSAILGKIGSRHVSIPFNSENLRVLVPESKYVNMDGYATYLSRTTDRQHKKGIRASQYILKCASRSELYDNGRSHKESLDTSHILALFNPMYPKFNDALEFLSNSVALSVAISPDFCLRLGSHSVNPILCYKGYDCGEVSEEGHVNLDREFYQLDEKLNEVLEAE